MTTLSLSEQEFQHLRQFIEKECGIAVGDAKSYLIETRLARIATEAGCDTVAALSQKLLADPKSALRDEIVDAMTTNETMWFRDGGPWNVLEEALLPKFCDELKAGAKRRIRIWSAASSTGQEPYSVAITILDYLEAQRPPGVTAASFEIIGTDISPSALFVGISGRYDKLAISRGLGDERRDKYFEVSGRAWSLTKTVKDMVALHQFNLMEPYTRFGKFDLILCRNVLIYFSIDLKRDILDRLSGSLVNEGALIIGGSESLQGALGHFRMCQNEGNFYYKVKASRGKP